MIYRQELAPSPPSQSLARHSVERPKYEPHSATTNIAFGGDDWRTLYITSRNHLGAVKVKIPGIAVPVTAK